MLGRRPWIEGLQHINIRNDFQSLVTNFMILHDSFCKEKNMGNFLDIADTCEGIVAMLDNSVLPDETEIATAFNNLTTQITLIQSKKQGLDRQAEFNHVISEITKGITRIPMVIQLGIKMHRAEKKAEVGITIDKLNQQDSTKVMQHRLTVGWTPEEMAKFINSLRELPADKTNVINRMAKKHPYLSSAGLFNLAAATGSVTQTSINILFNMYHCQDSSRTTADVIVPMLFVFSATILLMKAYLKSRPIPRPVSVSTSSIEEKNTDQSLNARLLPSDALLSLSRSIR